MVDATRRFALPAGPSGVARASDWLRSLGEEFGLSAEETYRLDLCAGELLTNVLAYAYPADEAGTPHSIGLRVAVQRAPRRPGDRRRRQSVRPAGLARARRAEIARRGGIRRLGPPAREAFRRRVPLRPARRPERDAARDQARRGRRPRRSGCAPAARPGSARPRRRRRLPGAARGRHARPQRRAPGARPAAARLHLAARDLPRRAVRASSRTSSRAAAWCASTTAR